jgi:hypothetical protein
MVSLTSEFGLQETCGQFDVGVGKAMLTTSIYDKCQLQGNFSSPNMSVNVLMNNPHLYFAS